MAPRPLKTCSTSTDLSKTTSIQSISQESRGNNEDNATIQFETAISQFRYEESSKNLLSVGELYRCILANMTNKEIRKALHKYRDLMPKHSDWNRKLTQATNDPEIGFRYLFRCGQIDENNHRTMHKMLRYIDRWDIIPKFETLLYNTTYMNAPIKTLKNILLDRVDLFFKKKIAQGFDEHLVHPEPEYRIYQHLPRRATRSSRKRLVGGQFLSFDSNTDPDSKFGGHGSSDLLYSGICGHNSSLDGAGCSYSNNDSSNFISIAKKRKISTVIAGLDALTTEQRSAKRKSQGIIEPAAQNRSVIPPTCNASTSASFNANESLRQASNSIVNVINDPLNNSTAAVALQAANLMPIGSSINNANVNVNHSSFATATPASCQMRMQVRAEYGNYEAVLRGRLVSNRETAFDRQLDLFSQASNLLRVQDLGDIICDIRFCELYHLDAFWKDYLSGRLAESIKEVFMRDNHVNDHINFSEVFVHVGLDRKQYEAGRLVLLKNFKDHDTNKQSRSNLGKPFL